MKRALVVIVLLFVAAGCGTDRPEPAPATGTPPASVPPPSASAAPSENAGPAFADLTQGSTKSVVKMYSYDAENQSAVVEPIIFLTGEEFCKAFKLKAKDPRCNQEWETEESHTKVTVPVAGKPKFFTWEGDDGSVCLDTPAAGGTCPMSSREFSAWVEENSGEMVAVTTDAGEITRMAVIYVP